MVRFNPIAQATRFLRARDGATAIEYALIASGVSAAIVVGVAAVGTGIMTAFYDKLANLF